MPQVIDISGQRFGRLIAIKCVGRKNTFAIWKCQCTCGNEAVVRSSHLRSGNTQSCGCLQKETASKCATLNHGDWGISNSNYRGHNVSYSGAHARVRRLYGPASEYECDFCNEPAEDWSLIHGKATHEEWLRGNWRSFSTNPDHYIPLCNPCHGEYDKH